MFLYFVTRAAKHLDLINYRAGGDPRRSIPFTGWWLCLGPTGIGGPGEASKCPEASNIPENGKLRTSNTSIADGGETSPPGLRGRL